ncbi:DNA polymerase III subunit delta [Aestuariivirga litoralis]|uniref:DNA polymerase III subunit delta n=1 Tax=Aestuariivirga litoralis TaxID=2650924 RepID=UPI0018C819B5|nr:DNA polymerase III subunit delta [Aestuariivirga litoralis]MBG1233766.1 DNA polymerase III subunit delta [Aestuariivirga litoralis]
MGVLREEEFEGFLKRRVSGANGILIHGADEAAVSLLGRQVIVALGGESQRVDISAAKDSPGSFADQFLSLSLLGDRQVLLVEPADDNGLKFLDAAINHPTTANFVVALGGNLSKSSKLRAACEAAPLFQSLVIYEEDEGRLRARIAKLLSAQGLSWGEDAEEEFFSTAGADRAIVTQEAEKLALYAHGQNEIPVADVQAICGNTAEFNADELIDGVLAGDLETVDRIDQSLSGELRSFFALFQLHLNKLQALRVEMERGMNADAAVRAAKPPIFFKRKPAIMNQLRILSLDDLVQIQTTILDASLQSRKFAALSEAINSRTLLSLARMCRSKAS